MSMLDSLQVYENLIEYFPSWMSIFKKSNCYVNLSMAFHAYLKASNDIEREECKNKMENAYNVFLHLCNTDPEGIVKKNEYILEQENKCKEVKFKDLYKKHMEAIKKEKI